ncbi:hypothetical protein [Lacinutrix undariae]
MYKYILSLVIASTLLTSCNKTQDPFLIGKQNIGMLTDSTQVKDLEVIFSNDSIVKTINGDEFTGNFSDINIFDKNGNALLKLSPKQALDSTSTIESVQIIDNRYKTEKLITAVSTFKDIQTNYKISRINNLINSIVVSVDELNASFTIDKKELPANLRFNMDINIEASQIPDTAKIKYFFIYWN